MDTAIKHIEINAGSKQLIQTLYETYAVRLLSYTRRNYNVPVDDATTLVYKTIYRIVEVYDRYSFENEQKRGAFVFKTYINYLRNYYRDNKSFESRNFEVELVDFQFSKEDVVPDVNPKLKLLEQLLDGMEDWERILLLMRGQGISYNEIGKFVGKPEKQLKVYYGRLKKKLLDDMNEKLKEEKSGK